MRAMIIRQVFTFEQRTATLAAERNPHRLGNAFRDYLLSAFEKAGVTVTPKRKPVIGRLCQALATRVCADRALRQPVAATKLLGVTAAVLHRAFKGQAADPDRLAEVLLSFLRLVLEEGMSLGRPFDIGQPHFREQVVELIRAENAERVGVALKRFYLPIQWVGVFKVATAAAGLGLLVAAVWGAGL